MNKIKEFLEGVRKEFNKVSWPTQSELIDNTTVVVVFAIMLSVFIFLVDRVFSTVLEYIY